MYIIQAHRNSGMQSALVVAVMHQMFSELMMKTWVKISQFLLPCTVTIHDRNQMCLWLEHL